MVSESSCWRKNCQDSHSAQYPAVDAVNLIDAAVKIANMIFPGAFGLVHFGHSTLAQAGRFLNPHVVHGLVFRESSM